MIQMQKITRVLPFCQFGKFSHSLGYYAVVWVLLGGGFIPQKATAAVEVPRVALAGNETLKTQQLEALVTQGKTYYEGGQYRQAALVLQRANNGFAQSGDRLWQSMTLANLSLAYQQLGEWKNAQESITSSLNILQFYAEKDHVDFLKLMAQSLDVEGRLHFSQGQSEKALESWQKSAQYYQKANDELGLARSLINQAQALQSSGLYRRSLDTLQQVNQKISPQAHSVLKATALRSLGNTLRLVGDLEQSAKTLQESLETAQAIQASGEISATLLSLGNTYRVQGKTPLALQYYEKAYQQSGGGIAGVQAQLNRLSLLVEINQTKSAIALYPQVMAEVDQLPASRTAVDAKINLVQSLMKLYENQSSTPGKTNSKLRQLPPQLSQNLAQILASAIQQAKSIQDPRAESYALGQLGSLYETHQQLEDATTLTQQALVLSQSINASDITYRWQWQLGRLFRAKGDTEKAIAAYSESVHHLQTLRTDLVAVNPDVQFSFRESVEPVYRQLVGLLLSPQANPNSKKQNENLNLARKTLESLQLAELVNFFRANCLDQNPVQIDQLDRQAAVIYPIILDDRLEVILSLPDRPLKHYSTQVSQNDVEKTVEQLRQALVTRTSRRYLVLSQQVYDWLLRPAKADLEKAQVKTLVFVPDGVLRNIPMGALQDGEQFLIDQYSIALTPGLQLLPPQPLSQESLKALTAGLTEARQNFAPLPNVAVELQKVKSEVNSQLLLNQAFTGDSLSQAIQNSSFPVIHLATHGQFSSRAEDTFILTWDDRINVNELNSLLQDRQERSPIELLVLSACQTAAGDKRAALGLAGVAVRAGARSTLATLWFVDDAASAPLMAEFYRQLSVGNITKAEALRRAQLSLKQQRQYRHPIYWAPYVLVGNWL